MGIPLPQASQTGNGAYPNNGTPGAGDRANAVVQGTFAAVGTSTPFGMYGTCNLAIWGSVAISLTTTAGSLSASVASATGLAAGMTINHPSVPPGTTIGVLSGTSVTLALPPGYAPASVFGGTSVAGFAMSAAMSATVQIERSFDGGATWVICNAGTGTLAQFINPTSVSTTFSEPEFAVAYRLNCIAYAAGVIVNYRLSTTGDLATSFGL